MRWDENIYNNYGNCISVRSNGIVSKNVVSNATKNGIVYFSDHQNIGNSILIENNIIYNCQRGIRISDGGEPYVDSSIVRFNTVITNDYNNNILVFPNPANNEINIELESTENFQITISNSLGKIIITENNKTKIDISNIPKGTYLICMKQGKRNYFKKFVKQ